MNLIDRYVSEVGSHLPGKQRADIQKEIKSLVEDMLAEKSKATGQVVDEKLTLQVFKELGKPEKVAASYLPPRYLIGPQLYPIFWWVLKISLSAVGGIFVLILAVRIAISDLNTWATIAASLSDIFNWLVATLGWVVVTFIIIERVAPPFKIPGKEKEWDPAELLKKPDADRIPLSTPITAIIFTIAALVVFNIFPGIPVIKNFQDGEWMTLISPSEAFLRFLPLINIAWVLAIGFHCVTLVKHRWSTALRLAYIGMQVYGIVIISLLLTGGNLIDINVDTLNTLNVEGSSPENITEILNIIVRASLGIAMVAAVIQIGTTVFNWMRNTGNQQGELK